MQLTGMGSEVGLGAGEGVLVEEGRGVAWADNLAIRFNRICCLRSVSCDSREDKSDSTLSRSD